MLVFKKKYYLFVENTREFNFNLIKIRKKFNIIYRNQATTEKIEDIKNFRNDCKKSSVNFYIANNIKLLSKIKADGLYISANNNNLLLNGYSQKGFKIIGAAHNQKEIDLKLKQGCEEIIFSRLFETQYPFKKGHLGIQKFNIISLRTRVELVPLGGINEKNLNKMNTVMSGSFACLSAIKKKPAKIINRLF
jgi:thiamine-phosphate pyrophosphorylase